MRELQADMVNLATRKDRKNRLLAGEFVMKVTQSLDGHRFDEAR